MKGLTSPVELWKQQSEVVGHCEDRGRPRRIDGVSAAGEAALPSICFSAMQLGIAETCLFPKHHFLLQGFILGRPGRDVHPGVPRL